MMLRGSVERKVPYRKVCAVLHPTEHSAISNSDVSPSIVGYSFTSTYTVEVPVSNLTSQTVVIPPRGLLCELQPVKIEDFNLDISADEKSILEKMTLSSDILTETELKRGIDLILEYRDIGFCSRVKHRIELLDEVPFKMRHRHIPPSMFEEVKQHLHQLLASGVIRRSYSPWASPVVIARKPDNSLRMCIEPKCKNCERFICPPSHWRDIWQLGGK